MLILIYFELTYAVSSLYFILYQPFSSPTISTIWLRVTVPFMVWLVPAPLLTFRLDALTDPIDITFRFSSGFSSGTCGLSSGTSGTSGVTGGTTGVVGFSSTSLT